MCLFFLQLNKSGYYVSKTFLRLQSCHLLCGMDYGCGRIIIENIHQNRSLLLRHHIQESNIHYVIIVLIIPRKLVAVALDMTLKIHLNLTYKLCTQRTRS